MKTQRHLSRFLAVLSLLASPAAAQSGNGLLLPFPSEAAAANPVTPPDLTPSAIPGRGNSLSTADTRRALELADTFLRRQQAEVSNSVPRRGLAPVRVPSRTATAPLIAKASASPPLISHVAPQLDTPDTLEPPPDLNAGPSSELLPLPGPDSLGAPDTSILPDAAAMLPPGQIRQIEGDVPPGPATFPDSISEKDVPRSELAPAPAYGSIETQDRRGPVFRIAGADAMKHARSRGYKFTPAGGIGARDGNHTAASQFPNLLTSEVHGTRMSQLRPPSNWNMEESSNTFFMFCDAGYNAARLAPGWRIRGIRLEGTAWRWVICPVSGANTASFSVRIHSYKNQETATSVHLAGLTLEGPDGATDWKEAFPNLTPVPATEGTPSTPPAAQPPALAEAREPELPQ